MPKPTGNSLPLVETGEAKISKIPMGYLKNKSLLGLILFPKATSVLLFGRWVLRLPTSLSRR